MIIIVDSALNATTTEDVRQSAIQGGFGTWTPPTHTFGSGVYTGMGYKGNHAIMHSVITKIMGQPIFPNQSFFRILTSTEDRRLIHSDRNEGGYTAITYLSDHSESGTAFFRHNETGLLEMPALVEMDNKETWGSDMLDDSKWTQTDFIKGIAGRTLIFSAPMFHGRVPVNGIGSTPEDARMIWVCHFEI